MVCIAVRAALISRRESVIQLYRTKYPRTLAHPLKKPLAWVACRPEPVERLFPRCQSCSIRVCVKEKELSSCARCDEFPCENINSYPHAIARQTMIEHVNQWHDLCNELGEEEGGRAFAQSQIELYSCENCGQLLYWGANNCHFCNAPVE